MHKYLLELSINKTKFISGRTYYFINIITDNPCFEKNYMVVKKCYSEFLVLHRKISQKVPHLPPFPEKRFFMRLHPAVVEHRRIAFEKYLDHLAKYIFINGFENESYGAELINFLK